MHETSRSTQIFLKAAPIALVLTISAVLLDYVMTPNADPLLSLILTGICLLAAYGIMWVKRQNPAIDAFQAEPRSFALQNARVAVLVAFWGLVAVASFQAMNHYFVVSWNTVQATTR